MKNTWLLFLFLFFGLVACQNEFGCPNHQDNEILTDNLPDSEAYQHELARLISEDEHEVNYYFVKREKGFLVVNAYGWGYCGKLHLLMKKEDDFSKKLQNGSGYGGAKLRGLKVKYLNKRLVYQSLSAIID